jgi:hypothetical protein
MSQFKIDYDSLTCVKKIELHWSEIIIITKVKIQVEF